MLIGVDYYPEHWPCGRWERDIKLMEELGVNVVRLAEFSWTKIEPSKGNFDFTWLDKIITILGRHGIQVVLGTPTATPPAWIIEDDPDILPVDEKGVRMTFGSRRHYCPHHPGYREHTERIVTKMAEHYKDNKNVIGWQIDNELQGRCYCNICRNKFQDWLKEKYETLDNLNKEYGTVFWSQIYTDWEQIPVPLATTIKGAHNPGLHLDYFRFMSDTWVKYQGLQVDILRSIVGEQWVTHNSMFSYYNGIDYSRLNEILDLVAWDNYPKISGRAEPALVAAGHSIARGLKGTGFWVMEEQSGPTGWGTMARSPEPGQLRLWSYQAVAQGADCIVYFRWRTCRFGTEQYWHGILDHHGEPGRRFQELKQFAGEMDRVGKKITPAGVPASAAVIKDYETLWAFEIQQNSSKMDYKQEIDAYYKSLYDLNITTDVITLREDFQKYKLLIVPNLYLVNNLLVERFEEFVDQGGTVLFSYRSGVKEARNNAVVNEKLPGKLRELVGIEIEEYTTLSDGIFGKPTSEVSEEELRIEFTAPGLPSLAGQVDIWAEMLKPVTAEPVAVYQNGIFADSPAITVNNYGKGRVVYVGTSLSPDLQAVLGNWLKDISLLKPVLVTPKGVEAIWRGEKEALFLLNHNNREITVDLKKTYRDLIGDKEGDRIKLAPYGVAVLKG